MISSKKETALVTEMSGEEEEIDAILTERLCSWLQSQSAYAVRLVDEMPFLDNKIMAATIDVGMITDKFAMECISG